MSRYSVTSRPPTPAVARQTPAIWRGIGCLLMMIVPTISWILAAGTVELAVERRWPVPHQLMGYPLIPPLFWQAPGLTGVLQFLQNQENLYAVLALCITYTIFLGAFISFVYALLYRLVGPPPYGPLDAPPARIRIGRYKR